MSVLWQVVSVGGNERCSGVKAELPDVLSWNVQAIFRLSWPYSAP